MNLPLKRRKPLHRRSKPSCSTKAYRPPTAVRPIYLPHFAEIGIAHFIMIKSPHRIAPAVALIVAAIASTSSVAAEPKSFPTTGQVESFSPVVRPDASIEILTTGMTWCEGPVWIGDNRSGHLLFSDIPRNTVYRWDETDGVSVFMRPSGYTGVAFYGREPGSNGLTLDREGRLLLCEHGDRRISRLTRGGGKRTLVDSFDGKRLNSPNDLVVAEDGSIYFTDPIYGLPGGETDLSRELDFCGVYCLDPSGDIRLITDKLHRPNGIGLSADQTKLIVAQSDPSQPNWTVFNLANPNDAGTEIAVATDVGTLPGLPDGLCVSSDDIIYASAPGGITVMTFAGEILGRFFTGRNTSNCTLSPDQKTLYITANDTVLRVRL